MVEMTDWLGLIGVKVSALIFGAIGAALGIAYTPQMTRREMFAALLAGLVCAAILPELVQQYVTLAPVIANGVAFIFGIGGMFLVPGILAMWRGFRDDPWSFIDRLRGMKKP